MFFKKKKQTEQASPPNLANATPSAASSQSVFAPSLNTRSGPIDFGFGQATQPAYQPDVSIEPTNPGPAVAESSGWASSTAMSEAHSSPTPEPMVVESLPNTGDTMAALWGQPENPVQEIPSTAEATGWASSTELPEVATQPYLTETFENYTQQPNENMSPAPTLGTSAPPLAENPSVEEVAYTAESTYTALSGESLPEMSGSPIILDAPETFTDVSVPDVYHIDTPEAAPDEGLSDWRQDPETASNPLDLNPAAFLDSVNQQLYPNDLFSSEQDDFTASEQAFEEASQFLFPETMGAPLDWSDDTATDPFDSGSFPEQNALLESTVDLGPSIQLEATGFNDISAFEEEPAPFTSFASPAHAAPLFLPEPGPVPISTQQPLNPSSIPEEPTAPFLDWVPESPLETLFPNTLEQPVDPFFQATNNVSPDLDMFAPAEPFPLQQAEPLINNETDAFWGETPAAYPVAAEFTHETLSETFSQTTFEVSHSLSDEFMPNDTWIPDLTIQAEGEPAMSSNSGLETPLPTPQAIHHPDDDFYAVSFTLNALGELVPDDNPIPSDIAAPPITGHETDNLSLDNALMPPEPLPETVIPVEPPAVAPTAFEEPPPQPRRIQPKPLMQRAPKKPEPSPTDPLEDSWHSEPALNAPVATPQPQASDLLLGNLEIISVCSLGPEKRLMIIHNNGVFALMGQFGLEQPQISVLKVFDHNPIAYQNTFTAVEEGQAGHQGMYVVQVGTWHGIISTFQDKITLHTELG